MHITNVMQNTMQYNEHLAIITYSDDVEMFRGEIIGLKGVVDFYSDSINGLKREFKKSIDTYLEVCEEQGINPYSNNSYISLEDIEAILGVGAVMQLVDYLKLDNQMSKGD